MEGLARQHPARDDLLIALATAPLAVAAIGRYGLKVAAMIAISVVVGLAVEAARTGVRFLCEYADHFHHAKEEDTLFPRFDPEPETVRSMKAEHVRARGLVRDATAALDAGETGAAADAILAHGELLAEHIRKEDEILFPWMNGRLATAEVGRLYAAFADIERAAGDQPARRLADIEALEVRFPT